MNEQMGGTPTAVSFHGSWTEFSKIVLPNVLLTLVTLGVYRFWATTRERQYLWSKTRFIDEPLEWTGRGIELFWGFVMVFFLLGLPLIVMQLAINGLIFRGQTVVVGVIVALTFALIFYLTGVAYFRTLRYRLSRTYWRGIRGGSDNPGFLYGWSYIWKNVAGAIPLYLLYPWANMSLWNERWNAMSFGSLQFESQANWTSLMKRYLLFYLVPFLFIVGVVIFGIMAERSADGGGNPFDSAGGVVAVMMIILAIVGLYILMPIAALMYYSKFFRVAVGGLKLGDLEFSFNARSPDWILYWLGNMVITMVAYGVAIIPFSLMVATDIPTLTEQMKAGESVLTIGFIISALFAIIPLAYVTAIIRYRSWKFFAIHTEAFGEVNLDRLTQSETQALRQGEGLLDAFDMGAI